MNAAFGIDHPLLATHDIEGLRARLISLGFNMTAIGKHPWGTSTSLAMFKGCLIEIMGIHDPSLVDEIPAGEFRFGRHVFAHLQQREGVALSALHSTDAIADAETAQAAGFTLAGHLEFGRDVTLPDGTAGRTKTTLALLPDAVFPRLSLFLCQQHRPDLIYVPEWLAHPNTVSGICGVNVVAEVTDQDALKPKFSALYEGAVDIEGGFACDTANGVIRFMTAKAFEQEIGPLSAATQDAPSPFIAGMDLLVDDPAIFSEYLKISGMGFVDGADSFTLTQPALTANTVLRFLSR